MYKLAHYEKVFHGTAEFPAAYYFVDEHHARYDMPFHWHKEWEIIHILQGTLILSVDGTKVTAAEGSSILLPEGVMHGGAPENNCIYECLVFDLHGSYRDTAMVKKYLRPLYRGQLRPCIYYPADLGEISAIVTALMKGMQGPYPELVFLSELTHLFIYLLEGGFCTEQTEKDSTGSRRIAPLKPVLEFIEDHYMEEISLEQLAKIAGMNSRYFCRFFSSITNQTPINYLNAYRMEQAALLLDSGDISVTDTALACGFSDASYFIRCFRKYRGVTPLQYRKSGTL